MLYPNGFLKPSSELFARINAKLNYTKMLKIKAWKEYMSKILTEIKLGNSTMILVKVVVAILKSEI